MDDRKFIMVFWFCCGVVFLGITYIFCLTFVPIPQASVRFADTSIGWIEGTLITAAVFYLLGGNPSPKKSDTVVGGDVNVDNSTTKT